MVIEDAHSKDVLRVVSYGASPPVLEKRHFFLEGRSGEWRTGKVRGLTGMDLAIILSCLEQFQEPLLAPWKGKAGT